MFPCRISRLLYLAITFCLLTSTAASIEQVAAQDGTNSAISGNTYLDPYFGYSVSWDDRVWTPTDEFASWNYTMVSFEASGSSAAVEGLYAYNGDPYVCLGFELENISQMLGVELLSPIEDENGEPLLDNFSDRATGLFELPEGVMGEGRSSMLSLECRVLIPGQALVIQTMYLDQGLLDAQVDDQYTVEISVTPSPETLAAPALDQYSAYMWAVIGDIEEFWADTFVELDATFEPPVYANVVFPVESQCGASIEIMTDAFYCGQKLTISFSDQLFLTDVLPVLPGNMEIVLGHEMGHHIWLLLDLGQCDINDCNTAESGVSDELMANCLGGAWIRDAFATGFFDTHFEWRTVEGIRDYLRLAGDADHGTGEQQVAWFNTGYEGGFGACVAE